MKTNYRRHFISLFDTFSTSFLVTAIPLIEGVGIDNWKSGVAYAIGAASAIAGVRAIWKVFREWVFADVLEVEAPTFVEEKVTTEEVVKKSKKYLQ